jgi:hypothetical protein
VNYSYFYTIDLKIKIFNADLLDFERKTYLQQFFDNQKTKANSFVRITYGVKSVSLFFFNFFVLKTFLSIKQSSNIMKNTNNPDWNHEFVFQILYPPVVRCLKIELIENSFIEQVIATEHIYIDDISHPYLTGESLPTFGPAYICLYKEPYMLTRQKQSKISDLAQIDGSKCEICEKILENPDLYSIDGHSFLTGEAGDDKYCHYRENNLTPASLKSFAGPSGLYVGRMKLQITSSKLFSKETSSEKTEKKKDPKLIKFTLFACINDVNAIDENYTNTNISFRINIGERYRCVDRRGKEQ